jgi:hypothetical protein
VHRIYLMQAFESVKDLLQEIDSFILRESTLLFTILFKITTIAELCDNENIITGAEGIRELDDVLIFYLLKDLNLRLDELLEFWDFFHLFFTEDFDGENVVSFIIDCLIDCAIRSTTEFRYQIELFDFFSFELLSFVLFAHLNF